MASAIIHICVAKKIGERLSKSSKDYYLGTIAPDISKEIGETKYKSHFLENSIKSNVPNIELFLEKYKKDLKSDFTLGYFIHLYTDKLWFDHFMDNFTINSTIRLMDGTFLKCNDEEIVSIIYSDYTNINIDLIDYYELDLSLFYEEFNKPVTKIDEIPVDKLDILVDKMSIIVANSKLEKKYLFDMEDINKFIDDATNRIYDFIIENNLQED